MKGNRPPGNLSRCAVVASFLPRKHEREGGERDNMYEEHVVFLLFG